MATTSADTRWVWYSGRRSLDFVNTRRDREGRGAEYLNEPADLSDWLIAAETMHSPAEVSDELFAEAVELREAINAGVTAAVHGEAVPVAALHVLNRGLGVATGRTPRLCTRRGLTVYETGPAVPGDARLALGSLALDAAQLVGTDLRARLRICPGHECGGRFLDDSPAARRRWCSMQVCGNRQKAASHRKRQLPR